MSGYYVKKRGRGQAEAGYLEEGSVKNQWAWTLHYIDQLIHGQRAFNIPSP